MTAPVVPLRVVYLASLALLAAVPIKYAHHDVVRWYSQYNRDWGGVGRLRQVVIDLVNEVAPSSQSYFYALSTHPFPGFPTGSYTAAQWSGRAASQFVIPAYARVDELYDAKVREWVIRAAILQRHIVVEDFERRPPSIVFVERARVRLGLHWRQFNDLGFYLQDPSFQKIWSNHYEDPPLGPLRVFIRRAATAVSGAAMSESHAPHLIEIPQNERTPSS